ncbi:hypothetical protein GCM10022247_04180 [Allokutzneria multivorans]|uniref:Uncharacterized protein n=1 Tax=Allokutzneria multivorans TaxID=1142134 RepID=A0ABP7QVU3_9PSEU
MKIRAKDGDVFHINEHHVIRLYRAVNRDRIGTSTGTHVVLLAEFSDWNGLAEKAIVSKAVFSHNRIEWKKKGTELFPSEAATSCGSPARRSRRWPPTSTTSTSRSPCASAPRTSPARSP